MKKPLFLLAFCIGLAVIVATAAAAGRFGRSGVSGADELGQIEQSIRDSIGWAKTKDFHLLYSAIANDPDFLEVHPDGAVVKGFEDFKKAEKFWGSLDFRAIRYEIRDLRIKRSKSGDVAWFFCLLDDINEWKGQPANWENTRWTGVLEKRKFCTVFGFNGRETPYVFSSHHQQAEKLGKGFLVIATSLDGKIVEAMEHERFPNVLAVQFHPEALKLYDPDARIRFTPEDKERLNPRTFLEEHPPSLPFHQKIWSWFCYSLTASRH